MANSKAISIRIPDELLEKVDRLAKEKYKSHKGTPNRSLVVLDAIAAYFDTLSDTNIPDEIITVSNSVSIVDFNTLRDTVLALSDTVIQLEHKLFTMPDSVKLLNEDVDLDREDKNPKQGQLDILALSDTVNILNATQLAKRLNVTISMITKYKNTPELLEWSREKDPDSIAWSYDLVTKKFSPANEPLA